MGYSPHLTTLCLFVHIHHPTELLFAKICLVLSMPSSAPELQGSESQLGIVHVTCPHSKPTAVLHHCVTVLPSLGINLLMVVVLVLKKQNPFEER